jgi:plasmid replication initiation protein
MRGTDGRICIRHRKLHGVYVMTAIEFLEHIKHLSVKYGINKFELYERYIMWRHTAGRKSLVGFEIRELQGRTGGI